VSDRATKFRREPADQRKDALIQATLSLTAERGVRGATVRAISARADVTQGLIRHYFSSKEDLITAAYEHHMRRLTDMTAAPGAGQSGSAKARLATFVVTGLEPPVVDPGAVSLWAGFLNSLREGAEMQAIHERTYHDFRDRLEVLIGDALAEADRSPSPRELRQLAIACNAVIDGLWMEGGALPSAFEPGELPQIGLRSVGAIVGLDLRAQKRETS